MSTVSFEIKVSLKFKDRRINRHKKKKLARCNRKRRADELSVTVPHGTSPNAPQGSVKNRGRSKNHFRKDKGRMLAKGTENEWK